MQEQKRNISNASRPRNEKGVDNDDVQVGKELSMDSIGSQIDKVISFEQELKML